jgi:hypothetical protein
MTLSITLIGGPTALIEIDGFRLLTDPTFDGPGAYQLPHVKLEKLGRHCDERSAIAALLAAVIPGRCDSIEPGILRFRVRTSCAPERRLI